MVLDWGHELLKHSGVSILYSTISLDLMCFVLKIGVKIWEKTCPKRQNPIKKSTSLMRIFPSVNLECCHGALLICNWWDPGQSYLRLLVWPIAIKPYFSELNWTQPLLGLILLVFITILVLRWAGVLKIIFSTATQGLS